MKLLIATLVVAFLATIPLFGSAVIIQFGISALLLATVAQGWNIIGGYTGYPSFGNSVFFGLGSYGVGIAMAQFGLPFAAGLALGVLLAATFAFLMGLAVLRLRGHYFAIATLAFTQVMGAIFTNLDIAGRNIGLVLPLSRGDTLFFELALGLLVITTATIAWLSQSRFGYGLIAIRENEQAAASMGINTTRYKTLAFVLSSIFTALAGGIQAYWITFIDPASAFDLSLNVKMIIMAIFGGAGTVTGPILGAFTLAGISEILAIKVTNLANLFFGFVIVVAIIFMPKGVIDFFRKFSLDNIRANRL